MLACDGRVRTACAWAKSKRVPAAARPGFVYSTALKQSKIVWTDAALDRWIQQPAKMVPGNKMFYPGMADPANRATVIASLKTLK